MADRVFEAFRPLANAIRVRAATTANVTIATALNAADTLDGVTLADEMHVLVKDQTAPAENGIYVVGTVPRRYVDFSADIRGTGGAYDMHPGLLVIVEEGTANADTLWVCTSNRGGTLGTTALAFTRLLISSEDIADTAGAMWTGNTESGATVTYQDADNTMDISITGIDLVTVDNTVPRFNSTAGAIQTSGVVITDSNHITGAIALQSQLFVLADDTATSFAAPSNVTCLSVAGNTTSAGFLVMRTVATLASAEIAGGANISVSTGALAGTTGVDGQLTISADTNTIYVENRLGGTASIGITCFRS